MAGLCRWLTAVDSSQMAQSGCRLIEKSGGEVAGCAFLVELTFLGGRERLKPADVFSLIQYG